VLRGDRCREQGDPHLALYWYGEALRAEAGNPDREAVHRTRLQLLLRQLPRVTQVWAGYRWTRPMLSAEGDRVLIQMSPTSVQVFDTATGAPVGRAVRADAELRNAALAAGSRILTVDKGGAATLTDPTTDHPASWDLPHPGCASCDVSPDGRLAYTASKDGSVQLWDTRTAQPLGRRIPPRKDGETPAHVAFDPTARLIATAAGTEIAIRRVGADEQPHILSSPQGDWLGFRFEEDGPYLLGWTRDKAVRWDLAANEVLDRVDFSRLRSGYFHQLVWLPGPRLVLSSSNEEISLRANKLEVLEVHGTGGDERDLSCQVVGRRSFANVKDVFVRPASSECLAVVGSRIVVLDDKGDATTLLSQPTGLEAWSFDASGRRLVTRDADGVVRLWDFAAGYREPLSTESPREVSVTKSSPYLIIRDKHSWFPWSTIPLRYQRGDTIWAWGPRREAICVMDWDGGNCAFGIEPRSGPRVWDAERGKPLGPILRWHGMLSTVLTFHPADTYVLGYGTDGSERPVALVWDFTTGRLACPPLPHTCPITATSFSPDGTCVVALDKKGAAVVWQWRTGKKLGEVRLAHGQFAVAAADPGGRRLATIGTSALDPDDWELRGWDVASGRPFTAGVKVSVGSINVWLDGTLYPEFRFTDDGRLVVYGSRDGLTAWDAATAEWVGWYPGNWSRVDGAFTSVSSRTLTPLPLEPLPGGAANAAALMLCQTGLQADPTGSPARVPMADLQLALQRARAGVSGLFDQSDETVGKWHERQYSIAKAQEHNAHQLVHLDRMLSLRVKHPELANFRRGYVRVQVGDWQGATSDFARAAEANQDSWIAWLYCAESAALAGQWTIAAVAYDRAAQLSPQCWEDLMLREPLKHRRGFMLAFAVAQGFGRPLPVPPGRVDFSKLDWYRLRPQEGENWIRLVYLHDVGPTVLDRAIMAFPERWQLLYKRSSPHLPHNFLGKERFLKAIADLTRAIELNPDSYQCWARRAHRHFENKEWKAAAIDYSKAYELFPYSLDRGPEWWEPCVRGGQYDTARRILESDHHDSEFSSTFRVDIVYWLVRAYIGLGRDAEAVEALGSFRPQRDSDREDLLDRARLQAREEADSANARLALAVVLGAGKQDQEAIRVSDEAVALNPRDHVVIACRAALLGHLGQWDAARSGFDRAVELEPKSRSYRLGRASASAQLRRWKDATDDYREAERLKPDGPYALGLLSQVALAAHDRAGYSGSCKELFTRFGDSADAAIRDSALCACLRAADAGVEQDKLIESARWLAQKDPKAWQYRETLALALFRARSYAKAEAEFERAAELRGDSPSLTTQFYWALCQARLGKPAWKAQAEEALAKRQEVKGMDWKQRLACDLWRGELEAVERGR
jgi:tetratricopeptide (TPR) repeat protein/WD40 repeat protein